jgi:hypothetical protein
MLLSKNNAHPRDRNIQFDPALHRYTITRDGVPGTAPVSVTSFSKDYFTPFNAAAVIEQRYEAWKCKTNHKYYPLIHSVLSQGGTDDEAKKAIAQLWETTGDEASKAGTAMHERFEHVCNGMETVTNTKEDSKEIEMLIRWRREFQPEMGWEPYRTEWMLWWEEPRLGGAILVAGTLDLLLRSSVTGQYALVDFKRTNPAPKYRGAPPFLLGPCGNPRFHPGYALPPINELENSKFGSYCMQLNILAKMLRDRYGVDVQDRMYLLQVHRDMDTAHCVGVPAMRQATNSVFAIEAEKRRAATESE